MKCDFCCLPDPTWKYPDLNFVANEICLSVGAWAACDTCHDLIQRNDAKALAELSTLMMLATHPELEPNRQSIFDDMIQLHQRFLVHRQGEPERITCST